METNSAKKWWRRIQWQFFLLGILVVACSFGLFAIGNAEAGRCCMLPGVGLILISLVLFVPTWFQAIFIWSNIGGRDIWGKRK